MHIVHINVTDKGGGAQLAGYRLHKGLLRVGADSTMFVQRRLDDSGDETIRQYHSRENLLYQARTFAYRKWISLREPGRHRSAKEGFIYDRAIHGRHVISQLPPADVIYVHSAYQFIDILRDLPILAERAHVVIFLHDMGFFTGGCTYARGCERFTDRCGACPLLRSHNENDQTRHIWERRHLAFSRMRNRLHFVAPSQWIAGQATRSSLLRNYPVEVIPYGTETDVFSPSYSQSAMRELLGIPNGSHVLGFLSQPMDRADKGFSFLVKALEDMKDECRPFLVTAGGGKPPVSVRVPHKHLGRIHDIHLLAAFYSAADIVVTPSLEDNLPLVAMEAMACGKPIVTFATGGLPEMVRQGVTGLVVPKSDSTALRGGIAELLQDSAARARMAENARKIAVEEYSLEVQARRHVDFCARITSLPIATITPGCGEESHKLVGKA